MSKKTMAWNHVLAGLLGAVVSLNAVAKTDDGSEASAIFDLMEVSPETLKVNDTVTLGRYYINDDTHKEPVEWRMLALKDHKALLISKYALGAKTLENSYSDETSWAKSTLRAWLNWEFFWKFLARLKKDGSLLL